MKTGQRISLHNCLYDLRVIVSLGKRESTWLKNGVPHIGCSCSWPIDTRTRALSHLSWVQMDLGSPIHNQHPVTYMTNRRCKQDGHRWAGVISHGMRERSKAYSLTHTFPLCNILPEKNVHTLRMCFTI